MSPNEILLAVLAGLFAVAAGILPTLIMIRQARRAKSAADDVDQRKVDKEVYEGFMTRYERERVETEARFRHVSRLLSLSVEWGMANYRLAKLHRLPAVPVPPELADLPFLDYPPTTAGTHEGE